MEQIKVFESTEEDGAGCAQKIVDRVNAWLKKNKGKIEVLHREVDSFSGVPTIYIFYITK